MPSKRRVENTVRDIRRRTRKKYLVEEKIRIVLKAYVEKKASLSYAARKDLVPMFTSVGRKTFWR